MATEGGVARTITGASFWQAASLPGVDSIGVFSVLVEPDGEGGKRLWVGSTQDGLGLYEKGRWRTFSRASGDLHESDVMSIRRVCDQKGGHELWLGISGGSLLRVREGPRFEPLPRPWSDRPGETAMDILARTVDGTYERWVGTRLSGMYRWREGRGTGFQLAESTTPEVRRAATAPRTEDRCGADPTSVRF